MWSALLCFSLLPAGVWGKYWLFGRNLRRRQLENYVAFVPIQNCGIKLGCIIDLPLSSSWRQPRQRHAAGHMVPQIFHLEMQCLCVIRARAVLSLQYLWPSLVFRQLMLFVFQVLKSRLQAKMYVIAFLCLLCRGYLTTYWYRYFFVAFSAAQTYPWQS